MNLSCVHVRELAAWGLDVYEYRPYSFDLRNGPLPGRNPTRRPPLQQSNALLGKDSPVLRDAFLAQAERPDLLDEMKGLTWSLGVVDLRALVAFQRRLFSALCICLRSLRPKIGRRSWRSRLRQHNPRNMTSPTITHLRCCFFDPITLTCTFGLPVMLIPRSGSTQEVHFSRWHVFATGGSYVMATTAPSHFCGLEFSRYLQ